MEDSKRHEPDSRTREILQWFEYGHLPEGPARATSAQVAGLAIEMSESLWPGPELTTGLRKLLEAKDCFVRQAIRDRRDDGQGKLSAPSQIPQWQDPLS
jgi:hypothetical protein